MQNPEFDLSRPPLRWMLLKAGGLGLRLRPFDRDLFLHEQINVTESLKGGWWPLELIPGIDRHTQGKPMEKGRRLM